jgi:phospholipase C
VARSKYWDSTAIFVTYDEGGGFWDHVAPSYASGYGTRTRGQATFSVKFPAAGYWRIAAHGPNGSLGWVTVDVSVNPDTAP